ncbi:MAG: thioredoxin-dependent thiol peroxidase [[Chlorobium] sp. 445]|nr:MAG: thioredoxin-dependent thiol peroxidase [[Chlorobium] sp. 445]
MLSVFSLRLLVSSFVLLYLTGCAAKPNDTALKVGDMAPDFELKADDGRTVKLSDYKDKTVVLFFYPKDETPGCTKEACAFRDTYDDFKAAGIEVFGISVDNIDSHQAFKKKQNLNFTLLSDETKDVSKKYGVLGLMGYSQRVTFLIGKGGIIKKIFKDVNPEQHAKEVLEIAKAV